LSIFQCSEKTAFPTGMTGDTTLLFNFRQKVLGVYLDCDEDVILLKIEQQGGIACHTGRESCFFRTLKDGQWQAVEPVLKDLQTIYNK